MVTASHALTVTSQMLPEPDVSRETSSFNKRKLSRVTRPCASEKEKSTARTRVSVSDACHIPEPRETTPSASQTHAVRTRSSHGSVPVLTAKKAHHQMRTEELALLMAAEED